MVNFTRFHIAKERFEIRAIAQQTVKWHQVSDDEINSVFMVSFYLIKENFIYLFRFDDPSRFVFPTI